MSHLGRSMSNDPLKSWSDGVTKSAILNFVSRVTAEGTRDFVPHAKRIAVFDNDGTLWPEQPTYIQFVFAFDRVKALVPEHQEWRTRQPFQAVLEGNVEALVALDEKGLREIITATHSGMTTDEFSAIVTDWLATTKDKRFKRFYTELVYQPMLELLAYLQINGFKTFIVSGAGQDFIRVFADKTYCVPPEQVVGSTTATQFQVQNLRPVLLKMPSVEPVEDGPGKPVAINRFIGQRPIFAFGNSDGDKEMLEWTGAGIGLRFMGILHHTDADREWAYDRQSDVGRLDKVLDEANAKGWTVVDMKRDWNVVFPTEAP